MSRILFAVAVFATLIFHSYEIRELKAREAARTAVEDLDDPLRNCAIENARKAPKDRTRCG